MDLYIFDEDADHSHWGGDVCFTVASNKEEALRNIEQDIVSQYGHPDARDEKMKLLRAMTPKICRSADYYIGE